MDVLTGLFCIGRKGGFQGEEGVDMQMRCMAGRQGGQDEAVCYSYLNIWVPEDASVFGAGESGAACWRECKTKRSMRCLGAVFCLVAALLVGLHDGRCPSCSLLCPLPRASIRVQVEKLEDGEALPCERAMLC